MREVVELIRRLYMECDGMTSMMDIVKKMSELNEKYGFCWNGENNDIRLLTNLVEDDIYESIEDIVYDYISELNGCFEDVGFTINWLHDRVFRVMICEFDTSEYR